MTTYNNLKYDHSFSANATGTGSLTKISSQTASNSTSLSFTTGMDTTYKEYVFKFFNMKPATDGVVFQFNLSTDGGSNYNVTKTSITQLTYHGEDGSAGTLHGAGGYQLQQSTAYQGTGENVGSDADQGVSGEVHFYDPSNTTHTKHYSGYISQTHKSDYSWNVYLFGYGNTTSAVDAIDFKYSSGNISSGTIIMYGVS